MALVFKTLILVLVTISTNGFLMSNTTNAPCRDDQPNCQILDDNFAVCKDPQKARELCRRYCNLCDTVDGDWSVWGTWGGCDVTCGNGTRRRTRSCNNPAPAHNGKYCDGSSTETGVCGINTCPVHGGWGQWSPFGSCSSTCGIGLKRRDRPCDNPWPSSDGNFCFGDNINYETCIGSDCPVDWLPWSEWSQCSGSCGDGMKTRQRTCQNAAVSHLLGNCTGQNVELVQCSQWNCSATVLFLTREVAEYTLSTTNQIIIFSEMLFNVGGGYNSSTGKFTAPVKGIYLFTVNLCPLRSGYIFYAIVAKEDVVANGHSFNVSGYNCVSGNTIVQLDANDVVYVKSTYNMDKLLHNELHDSYDARSNSFSGVLLH